MIRNVIYNIKQMNEDEKRSFSNELNNHSHRAFRKLYDLYGDEILRYIRGYFPFDLHAAEDILQEVFITAYTKISSLKDINKIRSWLYRIASGKSIDFKRKKKVEKEYMKEYGERINISKNKSVEEQAIQKEMFNTLNIEVCKLPDFLRKVYMLREFQKLKYQEIAEITETSLSRVKKAMKKAVEKLMKQLKKKNITIDT